MAAAPSRDPSRLLFPRTNLSSAGPAKRPSSARQVCLCWTERDRFYSSDSMNHAPENLSRRFVALDLPHYPRTSHLILGRFQRRQHAGVGQIQNLLETAPDNE